MTSKSAVATSKKWQSRTVLSNGSKIPIMKKIGITVIAIFVCSNFGNDRLRSFGATALETKVKLDTKEGGNGGGNKPFGLRLKQLQNVHGLTNLIKDDSTSGDSSDLPILKGECETCLHDLQCLSLTCSTYQQCAGSDGLADGNGCFCISDDGCSSGQCNILSLNPTCSDKLLNGDRCALDSDCDSEYCTWGLECADRLNEGDTGCTEDDDCVDDLFCGPSLGGVTECKVKLDTGTPCISDSQCASDDCGWVSFTCPRCCNPGPPPTVSPTRSPSSSPTVPPRCTANTGCEDGMYCGFDFASDGECTPNKDDGEGCISDIQCESGDCGYKAWNCLSCC